MVKCFVQVSSPTETSISKIVRYPDGVHRVLTMLPYQWEWVRLAEATGHAFNDVLGAGMALAAKFPSGKGHEYDILDCTKYMLMTIYCCEYKNYLEKTSNE